MTNQGAMMELARALRGQLALPISRANVWVGLEGSEFVLIVDVDQTLPRSKIEKIPSVFQGVRVLVREKLKPKAHFISTLHA